MEKLSEWFLNSDVFDNKKGAYRTFYLKKKKGPVYPEITAYAISLSCILYREKGDVKFLQRAKVCAEYLINLSKDGLPGPADNLKYLFDTGILISALFDLYNLTQVERYIDEAYRRLEWLCSYFDGEKFPAIVGHSKSKDWDKVSSIHLAKLSIPLFKGSKELEDKKYKNIAECLLNWAIKLQKDDGRFKINQDNDNTRLHPHCYTTEGFLFASQHTNEKLYWDVAKRAGDWLAKVQNEDGSLYQWLPKYPARTLIEKIIKRICHIKCTDVISQAIRIWKTLGAYKENINRAEHLLESMSDNSGLPLTKRKTWFIELKQREIYSWPTFFYIHSKLIEFGDRSKASEIF